MSSFFNHMLFATVVWPFVCFTILAIADKVVPDKIGSDVRIALTNVVTWTLGVFMLAFNGHSHLVSGGAMYYAYIGSTLAHSVFFIQGAPNWDRIGLAYVVYALIVYGSLNNPHILLPYFTVFSFFRSIQSVAPAATIIADKFFDTELRLKTFHTFARYAEYLILLSLCGSAMWTYKHINPIIFGLIDPVIFGLNFVTVYGTRFRSFIQKSHTF